MGTSRDSKCPSQHCHAGMAMMGEKLFRTILFSCLELNLQSLFGEAAANFGDCANYLTESGGTSGHGIYWC